jgi:hypothetical protein
MEAEDWAWPWSPDELRLLNGPAKPMFDSELGLLLGIDWNRSRGVIRCPAHDDAKPSLSYKWTNDGGLLLHCFAGCSFDQIRAAARGV